MRALSLILFLITTSFNFSAAANSSCSIHDSVVSCESRGATGLELFLEVQPHNIQRKLVVLKEGYGSVVLVQYAELAGFGPLETCWVLTRESSETASLTCSNEAEFEDQIPSLILDQL